MARGLIKQSKWTSNCGARRQEGRRRGGRDDVWSWVSELTGAGQGEGEKTCPPGNHKALSFSPCYNQHHHSKQHGLILTGLAGGPLSFYVAPCSPQSNPQTCQRELLWLFELCIRLICCSLRPLLLIFVLLFNWTFAVCWTFFSEYRKVLRISFPLKY